jgi:hypothetical protein
MLMRLALVMQAVDQGFRLECREGGASRWEDVSEVMLEKFVWDGEDTFAVRPSPDSRVPSRCAALGSGALNRNVRRTRHRVIPFRALSRFLR